MKTTPGNEADCSQMVVLMNLDKATGLAVETYTADRGYDDGGLREELKELGQRRGSTMPSSCADSARPRKMPTKRDG